MQKYIETDTLEPYRALANAIILEAVKDYRKALKKLSKYPDAADALAEKDRCERFFRSEWYGVLTTVDGEMLIGKLQKEVQCP